MKKSEFDNLKFWLDERILHALQLEHARTQRDADEIKEAIRRDDEYAEFTLVTEKDQ